MIDSSIVLSSKIILPQDKYDKMYFMEGGTDIMVVQIDSLDEELCGAVDVDGKEVIPCKYKGVGYSEYGTLIGSMTQTSDELAQIRKAYLAGQYQERQYQESQRILQENQQIINQCLSSSESSSTSSKSSSVRSSNSNSVSEVQNKNTDQRTYSDYESQLIKMNTYWEREYNDSNRRYIQQQMRQIRTKWINRGYSMYHSSWEDWDGKKK